MSRVGAISDNSVRRPGVHFLIVVPLKPGLDFLFNDFLSNVTNSCELADVVVEATDLRGIVELVGAKLPSTSKYYTMEDSLRSEAALYLLHNIGAEVFVPAIGEYDYVEENDEEAEDFRVLISRRVRAARDAAGDPDHRAAVHQALWCGEPLERLSAELQHLDAEGGCVKKVTGLQLGARSLQSQF